jgi:hypothetical protein
MDKQLPLEIEQCFRESAKRFGRSLAVLDWPNGGKDAPPHEANALINLWYFLGHLDPPFDLYAEGTINENCRVDVIGLSGDRTTAIAIEAKGFGKINQQSLSVLADLERLRTFRPSLSDLKGKVQAQSWWDQAVTRWGVIVISSFRGREVEQAWMAADEVVSIERMSTYSSGQQAVDSDGSPQGFLQLLRSVPHMHRRSEQITTGEQWGSGEGWLLWAGMPL